jgi:hypothetical protein
MVCLEAAPHVGVHGCQPYGRVCMVEVRHDGGAHVCVEVDMHCCACCTSG